jgi:hypothetical protein
MPSGNAAAAVAVQLFLYFSSSLDWICFQILLRFFMVWSMSSLRAS